LGRPRVAPGSASTAAARNASPHPLAVSATSFRVTPKLSPSVATGDGSSRRFEAPILSRCCLVVRRVSPALTLPAAPRTQAQGLPSSCIFRLCRRRTFEAIRRWRLSAAPTERFRVAPYRVRSVSPKTSSGSPRNCILRRRVMNPPSRLGRFTLRLRQRESPGRPESSLPSGFSDVPGPSFALALRFFGGAD
jgi:hypothetical protein